MTNQILGLDLGASQVKAAVLARNWRGGELERYASEAVVLDDRLERYASEAVVLDDLGLPVPGEPYAALTRLLGRLDLGHDTIHVALPGDLTVLRQTTLPLSASRKLGEVLRFEMDEALPFPLDNAVFDWVELERSAGVIRLIAAVVGKGPLAELLGGLKAVGVDPREVGVAPLAYASLVRVDAPQPFAVVDLGHQRSNLLVLDGVQITARTLLRGGRDLTLALGAARRLPFAEAARRKEEGQGLAGDDGPVLVEALTPLVRELKQSLRGHLAQGGRPVTGLFLAGGAARLPGIDRLLADELGVPIRPLHELGVLPPPASSYEGALAVALARRDLGAKVGRLDLRRGDLAFSGDREFIRRRAGWIAAAVLSLAGSWAFSLWADQRATRLAAEEVELALTEATQRLFGRALLDKAEIEGLLKGESAEKPPMPDKDAFDVLVEISKRIPRSVVHDVELLEIKPKRTTIKGVVGQELRADGAEAGDGIPGEEEGPDLPDAEGAAGEASDLSPTDLLQQKLGEFKECFVQLRMGRVQADGDKRRYQMDIESKCP